MATITLFAPELLADSAVAPSPEQRLKGVLDLSPDCVGGEVTALHAGRKTHPNIRRQYQSFNSPTLAPVQW